MTSINAYSVSLAWDASSYINSSRLLKGETRNLTRQINAARSPAERYDRAVSQLSAAWRKGAIDDAVYNRLLDEQRRKLKASTTATKGLTSTIKKLAAGWLSFHAANALLRAGLQNTLQVMRDIDSVAKRARGLDENYNALRRFQFAAGELAGVEGPAAIELLSKLNRRIGEAALGLGEAKKAFELLGVSVQDFRGMSPVQQFERVRDAISKIEDPTKRMAIAVKLFESEGKQLLPLLTATAAAFEESANQIDRFGLGLSEEEIARIEKTNDELGRMQAAVSGIFTEMAKTEGIVGGLEKVTTAINMMNIGLTDLKGRWDLIKKIDPTNIWGSVGRIVAGEHGRGPVSDLAEDERRRRRHPTGERQTGIRFGPELPSYGKKYTAEEFMALAIGKGDTTGGGVNAAIEGLKSGAGGLMDVVGAVQDSATMIALGGNVNTQELIKSLGKSPEIASLEAGTQEAYAFLNQATTDAAMKAAVDAENQKRLAENQVEWQKKSAGWLEKINTALEGNGFKRLPGR